MSKAAAPPTLVLLHFLGGSARTWEPVAARLNEAGIPTLPVDLPGFGAARAVEGYGVADMADHVARAVAQAAPERFALVGHSMGAKVALALARRAEDGDAALRGLCGVATVAGSPPGPEPMAEERRQTMMGWFLGPEARSRREAEAFIDANVVEISGEDRDLAVEDVLRLDPRAWRAWLDAGSREDWTARIGTLRLPALVIAGGEDEDLGAQAQARLMAVHFGEASRVTLPGAKHLLPLERKEILADLLAGFAAQATGGPVLDPAYRELIESPRVSPKLRRILLDRAVPDPVGVPPRSMSAEHLARLRAVLARLVPHPFGPALDLAGRLDAMMAEAEGNGWRFEALPGDPDAYHAALDTLGATAPGGAFETLDEAAQDHVLDAMSKGDLELSAGAPLDAAAMKLWFGEVLSDAVRLYAAHPAVMARLGYSGIANGGEGGALFSGFQRVGISERESFEPAPLHATPIVLARTDGASS